MPIEKLISFYIEKQFPAIYRESGKELIQFVKEYYKFLETDTSQSIYNGRRLLEYRDIDTTLERMLIFYKNKYLADLPFDDSTIRLVVKNILGLYRRKGTQNGLELFFRIFYNEDIKLYYPAKDILKPSSSEWKNGNYLQIIPNSGIFTSDTNKKYTYKDLIGLGIIGKVSKATAVVDKVNFITLNNTIIPIMFINDISGIFIGDEEIICEIDNEPIKFGVINGSFTSIEIDSLYKGTIGNEVGDLVTFTTSPDGIGAKGLVTEVTENFSGTVNYKVTDGGWGYSIGTTKLLVSNQIIFYEDDQIFDIFPNEDIIDQLGNSGIIIGKNNVSIGIKSNTGSDFSSSSIIETISRNSLNSFKIANTDSQSSIITLPEAILKAASNIEPEKTRFEVIVSGSRMLGDITNNGNVEDSDSLELLKYLNGTQTNQSIIDYIEGDFKTYIENNPGIYGDYPAYKYVFTSIVAKNDSSPGDLYPDTLNTSDVIVAEIDNEQTISIITDVISDYTSVTLNASNYNDPPAARPMSGGTNPTTINTTLDAAFSLNSIEIGRIVGFKNINPGSDYLNDVFAIAYDSRIEPYKKKDQLITISTVPATLSVGSEISQSGINGKVLAINGNTITVRPYSFNGYTLGVITFKGVNYEIVSITTDYDSNVLGLNAVIDAVTEFGVGKITKVKVLDSGYGYIHNSIADVIDSNGKVAARGVISAKRQGTTGGYWSSLNSHLNGYVNKNGSLDYFESGKHIQDSRYYQEYSYEILSKLNFETYEEPLKEITHVAGTKVFGKFNLEEIISTPINSKIELDLPEFE